MGYICPNRWKKKSKLTEARETGDSSQLRYSSLAQEFNTTGIIGSSGSTTLLLIPEQIFLGKR